MTPPLTSDVLLHTDGALARITLNRPRALNALTHEMIRSIDAALAGWAEEPAILGVLIDGAGERGLCAGGDIRALYNAALAGDLAVPAAFFGDEYRMNARIAAYPKPYIAFMDGIVMGGGIGVSAHGSMRVVTERSRLAMPETGIGFVVDVGGTWLLSRAPHQFGTHAALTAAQLGPADALLCGFADAHIPAASLSRLATELAACSNTAQLQTCIATHATPPAPGLLADGGDWIASCYGHDSMEAIVGALQAHPAPAAQQAAREIAGKSPTSLKVTLRALRSAPGLGSLAGCLAQEYRLVMHSLTMPDFGEGVRAAVIDKDRNPAWSPARLEDVTNAAVAAFFNAPDHGGLGLPT